MNATVVVATYGEERWKTLAWQRAIPSALAQGPCIHAHRETLADARNAGLASVETEYVIHLDADDELEPGYVEAMGRSTGDLRAPSVRYVKYGTVRQHGMPKVAGHRHICTPTCLSDGNWLIVGTCARTQLLRDVGGWEDWPVYEDWALWLRCWKAGAVISSCPEAVYRAHVRFDSRNRAPNIVEKNRVHAQIVESVLA